MPRIKASAAEYAKKDLVIEIKKSAYALYGSLSNYSKRSPMSQATLSRRTLNPDDLTLGELRTLRKDLQIDKEQLMKLIGAMI